MAAARRSVLRGLVSCSRGRFGRLWAPAARFYRAQLAQARNPRRGLPESRKAGSLGAWRVAGGRRQSRQPNVGPNSPHTSTCLAWLATAGIKGGLANKGSRCSPTLNWERPSPWKMCEFSIAMHSLHRYILSYKLLS